MRKSGAQEGRAAVLRDRRDDILHTWEQAVKASAAGPRLDGPSLRDHVTEILDRVAALLSSSVRVDGDPREHGRTRARQGVGIVPVLAELGVLRKVVLDFWTREGGLDVEAVRALDGVIDEAAMEAARHITETYDAFFRGVDAISRASLESRDVDDLLQRMLEAIVRTSGAVDAAAILLREGDRLRVRAAAGVSEVSDTGPGLAPEEVAHVFEPYRRGFSPGYKGTGLGLAIAQGIVAAHGGRIGVDTAPGNGAAFWFTLPTAPPDDA